MNTTNSYLYTLLDRIRATLDEPDLDAKYSNDYLIRHVICPAQVDVISRLNNTISCPVVNTLTISLIPDEEIYPLPPCVQEVLRLIQRDSDTNNIIFDAVPEDRMHPSGTGWSLEGMPGCLELHIDPSVSNTTEVQLWYVSNGDILPHYSTAGTLTASKSATVSASVTAAAYTLTRASGDWTTTFAVGDLVNLTGFSNAANNIEGARITAVSALVITFDEAFTTTEGPVSVTLKSDRSTLTLSNSPTLGVLDQRPSAYVGQILRLLPASPLPVEERIIETHYELNGAWYVTVRKPFGEAIAGTVIYEIVPAGSQSFIEAVAAWSAMKLAGARKISEAHYQRIRTAYLAALKTIGDNVTNIQTRRPKSFVKGTVDNPFTRDLGFLDS